MNVAAGLIGIVFGLLHGLPSLAQLRSPTAARGSHEPGAVPVWARVVWLGLAIATVAGGVTLCLSAGAAGVAVASLGAVGIFLLAIANGFWMHGRPSISHHIVRGVAVAVLITVALLSLSR